MKHFLTVILLFAGLAVSAQTMTSYSPGKFNFESGTPGAEVYYAGTLLGRTPFSAEVKPAYRTESETEGLSEFEIYSRNTTVMERELKESGEDEGIFSRFAMDFEFVMPDGSRVTKTVRLMWKPATILGAKGFRIYYPPLVKVN